ncbi:hypothetical protein SDC9_117953 [bioreactor metagenome]|uniref:Uncharacterized protein n=1 Tax=bioreactor metagenome TaxID=1076179 RepID=A0A645BZP5_9ZZZZ
MIAEAATAGTFPRERPGRSRRVSSVVCTCASGVRAAAPYGVRVGPAQAMPATASALR